MKGPLKIIIIIVVALACAGAADGIWTWHNHHAAKPLWRTGAVRKGNLTATITATGTVEPEELVDVGAQVSGQFLEFGKDKNGKPIDYDSVVESNMVLAQIDTTLFQAQVDLDTAQVASDKAMEAQSAANLEQMKAKAEQAEADWNRAQKLGPSEALAQTTYDSYKAAYSVAKANVDMASASVDSAKAATREAQATLAKDKRNLDYCTIYSPVDGVIIDRRVTIGETVASSLNTPSLFLIAKDLKRLQVWASVSEADIGNIHPGQGVNFTVDAYPNRVFRGSVNKVRLNATMSQNVVTFTVEVNTDNSDGTLIPYLTANVSFLAGKATNAFLVSNSALRWHPQTDLIAPEFRQSGAGASGSHAAGGGGGGDHGSGEPEAAPVQTGTLWAAQGNFVRPVPVKLGLTDGTWTEVQGEDVSTNLVVVTGTISVEAAAEQTTDANPFVPQIGQRRGTNAAPMRRGGGPLP